MNETRSWNSAWFLRVSILLNKAFITWGISPVWESSLHPVPMVYVFPEPVCAHQVVRCFKNFTIYCTNISLIFSIGLCYLTWPYARTVALYPWNKPSTSGATHSSNMRDDGEAVLPYTWSKVNEWVPICTCTSKTLHAYLWFMKSRKLVEGCN